MSDSTIRNAITCSGRENDYSNSDTPVERLKKIAAQLVCHSRSRADGDDPISEPFGFTLEAMDQYADHILAVVGELEKPAAGTHAYELIAATEAANIQNTETLIHLVAATVLCNLGEREVSFTPADMDHMHQHFIMSAVRDGMSTTVKIERRDVSLPPMALQPGIDDSPAEPQAPEHVYDRPLWAVRVGDKIIPALDRIDAETRQAMEGELATVENRFCYHPDCPSTGCQRAPSGDGAAEVTSAA